VALSIGPEGGWDESEITGAENAGWDMLSLGESTLRAETAAIAAVTLARLTGE
jgi:16S rRNA (uracil1498-N3)-methyltransferase